MKTLDGKTAASLSEQLAEMKERNKRLNVLHAINSPDAKPLVMVDNYDIPKLIAALERCMEQRDQAYVCSWDKSLGEMIVDDDKELQAILAGEGEKHDRT